MELKRNWGVCPENYKGIWNWYPFTLRGVLCRRPNLRCWLSVWQEHDLCRIFLEWQTRRLRPLYDKKHWVHRRVHARHSDWSWHSQNRGIHSPRSVQAMEAQRVWRDQIFWKWKQMVRGMDQRTSWTWSSNLLRRNKMHCRARGCLKAKVQHHQRPLRQWCCYKLSHDDHQWLQGWEVHSIT